MGQAYLCRKSGEAGEEKLCFCSCPYIHPSPSIRVLGILFVCISQGICKQLIRKIISPQKTVTKVSLWKMSRKFNSSSSSFSSPCSCSLTLTPPSHQLDSWLFVHFPMEAGSAHAGMWEDEEEAKLHRGLPCFSTFCTLD